MASYLRTSVYCLPTDRRSLCLRPGRGPSMLPLGGTTSIRDTLARYRSSGRRFAVLLRPGLDCWSLELRTLNPPFNGSTSRSDPLPVAPPIAHSANQVSSAPHPTLDRSARNDVSGNGLSIRVDRSRSVLRSRLFVHVFCPRTATVGPTRTSGHGLRSAWAGSERTRRQLSIKSSINVLPLSTQVRRAEHRRHRQGQARGRIPYVSSAHVPAPCQRR
jgi:hypothetical protein